MLTRVSNRDTFFKETSERYTELLEEHNNSIIEVMGYPWGFVPIYNILGLAEDNVSSFKSISENINSITDYTVISMGISIIESGNTPAPHYDLHPTNTNFKRYHLPLQITDTAFLYVEEGEEWKKYPWKLGKWMQFTGINHLHYPLNEDENGESRIVLLMDVFDGEVSDEDVYEYYEEIERLGARINGVDFRPYYDKYIQNKTLL
jgi:hypothetical protein